MHESNFIIVKVKNISPEFDPNGIGFDFNGDLGARFDGRDFFIPKGGSLMCPKSVGDHLAKHLAQAIRLKYNDTSKGQKGDGKDVLPLWNDDVIKTLVEKMVSSVTTEERPAIKTEGQLMEEKIKELNKGAGESEEGEEAIPTSSEGEEPTYKTKADIIAELEKRGITFDARAGKATLEALLK